MDIYREKLLDHYRNPRNSGELKRASACAEGSNPFCGDEIAFCLRINSKKEIAEIAFVGSACAICTASASMLSEEVRGKGLKHAREYSKKKLLSLMGVDPGPTRLKCALLPLKVLKVAIYKYLGRKMGKEDEELV